MYFRKGFTVCHKRSGNWKPTSKLKLELAADIMSFLPQNDDFAHFHPKRKTCVNNKFEIINILSLKILPSRPTVAVDVTR